MRLLTNLETATTKLLQIILIGQPELRELLEQPDLRQLAQRITGRYHLSPLSTDESAGYVKHRMRVAGATAEVFTPAALREMHRLRGGIPRLINVICDRALLGAYTRRTTAPARPGAPGGSEVYGRPVPAPWLKWATAAAVAAAIAPGGVRRMGAARNARRRTTAAVPPAAAAAAGRDAAAAPATPAPQPTGSHASPPPLALDRLLVDTATTRRPKPRSASCSRCGARCTSRRADAAATRPARRAWSACSRRAPGRSCAR